MAKDKNLSKIFEGTASTDLNSKIREFKKLKQREKSLNKELEDVKKERAAFEEELGIMFENEDVTSVVLGGYTFYTYPEQFASIPAEFRAKGYKWLKKIRAGSLIYPTVNAQKFSAFIKELQQREEDIPDFIKIFPKKRVGVRKGRGK